MSEKVSTFAKRLREGLSIKNISQTALSTLSGVSKSSISRYLKGDWEGKQDAVYTLAKALEVSEAWLMGYDVPMERVQPEKTASLPLNLLPLPSMKKVPLLGTIACGEPILAEENFDGYVEAPSGVEADFSLRCHGDSMINARIMDGDLVFIRQQPDVDNGDIAAVLIDGEATLKRVYKYENQIILQPENPKYAPMVFSGEALLDFRIIGKAVAFLSAVR